MNRIYHNFIEPGSPMELNVSTKQEVKEKLNSLQWAVITRDDAVDVLNNTEQEVLASLVMQYIILYKTLCLNHMVSCSM